MGIRSISETADLFGVRPADISRLFHDRKLRRDCCIVVGNRTLVPDSYLAFVALALHKAGKMPAKGNRPKAAARRRSA